jgi:hypothetical protein
MEIDDDPWSGETELEIGFTLEPSLAEKLAAIFDAYLDDDEPAAAA